MEKKCNECQTVRPLRYFSRGVSTKDGYATQCHFCRSKIAKMTPEERANRKRKKQIESEIKKEIQRKANIERSKKRYYENRQKIKEYNKKRYDSMTEEERTVYRAKWQEYKRKRKQKDPIFAVSERLRSRLSMAFKQQGWKKPCKTEEMVGCDYKTLQLHLIQTALIRYGFWSDVQEYHIDHIVPIKTAKSVEELIKLNHFLNLQLLTPRDNLIKSAK